jgi:glycosyltransferase involved in cell wall biosynthesis
MSHKHEKTMRIAILVQQFPNIVQTYIISPLVLFKKAGIKATIIAIFDPIQNETHPYVEQYGLRKDTIYIDPEPRKLLTQILKAPLYRPRYLASIFNVVFSKLWKTYGTKYTIKAILYCRSLATGSYDIVHSHTLFSSYEYLFLKDIFSIPLVTTFHGLEPKNAQPLAANKVEMVLKNTDAFIVNTVFAQQQLTGMGCNKDKIHIIPQGTDTADFPFLQREITSEKPIVILSVGRLSIEKGFHIAVKAISSLAPQHPGIQYRIIGSGPEEKTLTRLCEQLGIQQHIHIHGSVSTDELLSHYSEAHIFVLPSIDFRDGSHTETQGVVLQEAQSSGIPVIASRTGGIPEVIKDRKTGLLFEEENDTQLSQLIESLIDDREQYRTIAQQARKDVEENYSIEVIGERLIKLYEQYAR